MGLLDELQALKRQSRPGPKCTLGRHLCTLTEPDRAELINAIRSGQWPHGVISAYLAKLDPPVKVDPGMIGRHRCGDCAGCDDAGYFPRVGG